jgi:hypothetical protein
MENSTASNTSKNPENTDQKQAVIKDICAKWSKFSEQDASALKGKSDLVTQVASKYSMPQTQAQTEVDALLKGRQVGAGT